MGSSTSRFIERRYRIIFWPILVACATFGTSYTTIGALLPRVLSEFGWTFTLAGLVIAANSVGYFTSTLLCGVLVHRFGLKPVVVVGLVLQAASLFLFGTTPSAAQNAFLSFFIGVGGGAVEVTINSSAVRMERPGQSHLMSFIHASFSVGAIVGPVVIGLIVSRELPWQGVYRALGLVSLAIALLMALLPFRVLRYGREPGHDGTALPALFSRPLLFLAFFALFLYVGFETGITNWLSEYFVRVLGTPAPVGAFMVALFWAGILVGRVVLPVAYRGERQAGVLVGLAGLYTVSLVAGLLVHSPGPAGLFFFLASLGCSAVYPIVMTLLGRHFSEAQSVAVGFVTTGGGIGMLVFPLAMAGVAERSGLRAGFLLYALMGAALFALALFIRREIEARREVR